MSARLALALLALALSACFPGARLPRDTPVGVAQGFPGAPVPLPNPSYAVPYADCTAALSRLSGFRTVGRERIPVLNCYLIPTGGTDLSEVVSGLAEGYRRAGYALTSEVSERGLINQLWFKASAEASLDVSYWLSGDELLMSVFVQAPRGDRRQ